MVNSGAPELFFCFNSTKIPPGLGEMIHSIFKYPIRKNPA